MNSYKHILFGFTILLAFLYNQCKNDQKTAVKHGELIEKFPGGKVEKKYILMFGKKDGEGQWFYEDGTLRGSMNYKNDLQDGKTEYYYHSGNRREVQYFKEGKKIGMDTVWNDKGQILQINQFENGKLQGDQYHFDSSGKVTLHAVFNADTVVKVIEIKK